jgi:hypothetical protein
LGDALLQIPRDSCQEFVDMSKQKNIHKKIIDTYNLIIISYSILNNKKNTRIITEKKEGSGLAFQLFFISR